MITEDDLRAAADTIDEAWDTDLSHRLSAMQAAREARTQWEVSRQQAEIDSFELEKAAYQLGRCAHDAGDLETAARWYLQAALNDFADSQLMLAKVLDSLAEQCLERSEFRASQQLSREELHLVSEAARWYLSAYAAGEIEAIGLLDVLIVRHAPISSRPHLTPVPVGR